MFKRGFFLIFIIVLWNLTGIQAQSIYTDREDFTIQLNGGVIRVSQEMSGSTIGAGISVKRNLDLFFATSNIESRSGYYNPYRISSGGLGFYPFKQWEDQPVTVQIAFTGSKSTLYGFKGWSFLTGATATRELSLNESFSFYPAVSFNYAPFTNNKGDGSTLFGVEGSFSYDIVNKLKLIASPTFVKRFDSTPSTFGFSMGIVL